MKDMIRGKIVESIQNNLPGTNLYSGEAYIQLIDDVIEDLFGSKVGDAVQRAHNYLYWDEKTKQYDTVYK